MVLLPLCFEWVKRMSESLVNFLLYTYASNHGLRICSHFQMDENQGVYSEATLFGFLIYLVSGQREELTANKNGRLGSGGGPSLP
jgi:hypothetical protein